MEIIGIIKGSVVMMVLVIFSIVAITIIIERAWFLAKCRTDHTFMTKVEKFLKEGLLEQAIDLCKGKIAPLPRIILTGLTNREMKKEEVEELMSVKQTEEKMRMERFLPLLGGIGTIAPLLGLLGTVIGLVRAFRDLALAGSAGPTVVAAGISEALYTTIAGLAIAIPTILIYITLTSKVKRIGEELENASKRLLVIMFSEKHGKEKD